MQKLLRTTGFESANVTCGIVYFEGVGTVKFPPVPIQTAATMLLKAANKQKETEIKQNKKEESKTMAREYRIYETLKARQDMENCVVCGNQIFKGQAFKYAEPSLGRKVFFCTVCPVDQSKISKNSGNVAEPQPRVSDVITVDNPIETTPEPISRPLQEEPSVSEAANMITDDAFPDEPISQGKAKVFCSKCQKNHEVGSGKYTKHIKFCS